MSVVRILLQYPLLRIRFALLVRRKAYAVQGHRFFIQLIVCLCYPFYFHIKIFFLLTVTATAKLSAVAADRLLSRYLHHYGQLKNKAVAVA